MSQYNSRILIKVKDIADWKKLADIDFKNFGFYANPFDGHEKEIFDIIGDWACFEDELIALANAIVERIPNCILFGDTTNINVDPYAFIVYHLGDGVYSDEIEGDFQWETELYDPFNWLQSANITLTDKNRAYLAEFGFKE